MGTSKMRFELNVLNVFNQKTATHIFNYLNKGAGLARGDAAIDLSKTDLAKGYDYNALILASTSAAERLRPALRSARPVPDRHAGTVQRQVPVLTRETNQIRPRFDVVFREEPARVLPFFVLVR